MAKEEQGSHQFTNRLIHEKSLYLLQHAHNPVNWYPWGQEAFTLAQESDKPIFLSIGYSTCHWCHVMEEEVFQDLDAAKLLNDSFVCIKVDREELPEVDALYMEFAQSMIVGSAGWPLNVLLTPELKPFFAATYLPKNASKGLIGIMDLTKKMHEIWQGDDKEKLLQQSHKVVELLREHVKMKGEELPHRTRLQAAAETLFKVADPLWGGMRGAPKFPLGYQTQFLLHYYSKTKEVRALYLVEKTLEMMQRGGIYDHLGGGFHRYSVDERWEVPHFEKMLYDNALLSLAYLDAFRMTGNALYKKTCNETLHYLMRLRVGETGAFAAAEDADSAGCEGLYYTWTLDEIMAALGADLGGFFADFYSVTKQGNFEGRSVLYMLESIADFAAGEELSEEECRKLVLKGESMLRHVREGRIKPLKDDKIITSWNGLAIHAFARAGLFLQSEEYLQVAKEAALFLKNNLYKEGVLYRRYRDGEARFRAGLEDYAFLIQGLLSLFEAGGGVHFIEWAIELSDILERDFKAEEGAFFQTDGSDTSLLVRKSHFSDGAEPSGNAVHTENLLRLYQITWNKKYLSQAEDVLKAVKRYVDAYPLGYCYHLIALNRYLDEKKSCMILSTNDNELKREVGEILCHKDLPHTEIIFHTPGDGLEKILPNVPGENELSVCYEGVCDAPVKGRDRILEILRG